MIRSASYAAILLLASTTALAQSYPTKQIQIVSSASIASSGDAALRLASVKMSQSMGHPIIIEFRGGAGGALAAQSVVRAPADGYTLMFGTTGSFVFARYLMKNLPFDITKDFAPVSLAFSAGAFLAVNAGIPVNTFQELVEYSKRNPGKLSYASTGIGSIFHLLAEGLRIQTGINMVHIPYSQANYPQLVNDWSTGRIDIFIPPYPSLKPVQEKMKVFAAFDRTRDPRMPNVPQINEVVPKFENVVTWWGYFGPAGLPKPIAERFAQELKRAIQDPSIAPKMDELGMTLVASTPDELATTLRGDLDNTARIVKVLGIQPQ